MRGKGQETRENGPKMRRFHRKEESINVRQGKRQTNR